ncbi:MAG TPA: hypothetical protein VNI55_08900 [Gaiellaceae bacterium]|nr:hypothetical protein [Gaiellaceae bacterium]
MVAAKPWDSLEREGLPDPIQTTPGMLTWHERKMLYWLARDWYEGVGQIVDAGAYLGLSAVCFRAGLHDRGMEGRRVHSYDMFQLGPFEQTVFEGERPPHDATLPLFEKHTSPYRGLGYAHAGNILNNRWADQWQSTQTPGGEVPEVPGIEILFVDVAKTSLIWDHLIEHFFPHLIARRSLLILQDYMFSKSGAWHHITMEKLREYFPYVTDTGVNSVLFECRNVPSAAVLAAAKWSAIPDGQKPRLLDSAIGRFSAEQQEILQDVRAQLQ